MVTRLDNPRFAKLSLRQAAVSILEVDHIFPFSVPVLDMNILKARRFYFFCLPACLKINRADDDIMVITEIFLLLILITFEN